MPSRQRAWIPSKQGKNSNRKRHGKFTSRLCLLSRLVDLSIVAENVEIILRGFRSGGVIHLFKELNTITIEPT
jgi:hypothetical protein